MRLFTLGLCIALISIPYIALAKTIDIAVLETEQEAQSISDLFKKEIKALFEGEHRVAFTRYRIKKGASASDINALMDAAYANKTIDYVLVLDIPANQVAGQRTRFAKPTFLPIVLNGPLLGYPEKDGSSGKMNLSYTTQNINFERELATLKSVASFDDAVLIADPQMAVNIEGKMKDTLLAQAQKMGIDLQVIPFEGTANAAISKLSSSTDAVLYGAFPNQDAQAIEALINAINARGLPSFSLSGEEYVRLGALATNHPDTDWKRLARHTAIQMQEVLLGTPASRLPVYFETSNRLIINMATSRQIRIAPSFDILSDATLLNNTEEESEVGYTLTEVARRAVDANLSLAVQKLRAEQAGARVDEVRGGLLPRFDAGLGYDTRKESANTRSGFTAEDSIDGTITLTQPLFNEDLWAAFTIEKFSALSEEELLRETELDITQSAVNAYLNVLREQTSLKQESYNLNITRENYRLAKTRVEVGDSDKSDLYRWESELANAKQSVLEANSQLQQSKQNLNAILDRPIKENFATAVETLDNPDLLVSDDRITRLITNRYSLEALTDFFVDIGLERSPELKQAQAQIDADKRQLLSDGRAYWVPDIDLTAQYSNNFDETRNGGVATEGDDWTIGVDLTIPLYEGGSRAARKSQSRLAVKQGEANLRDTRNSIEQEVRSQAEEAHASYQSIALANTSEKAAQQNYELVSSSYAQGQVAITDLLDAQESLIEAREASMNATYSFLIDLMNLQRAIGAFDFFLTDTQRMELSEEVMLRISNSQ